MYNSKVIILGVACVVCATIVIWKLILKNREYFKVLGSLGPYKELYYKCNSDCERSDPGKQLTPGHGNMMCKNYCDSTITDISRRGGPSYPLDFPVKSTSNKSSSVFDLGSGGVMTSIDEAYKFCGDGEENSWCRQNFHTASEIDAKCRQDCEYSTYPTKECMSLCAASKSGNYSLGWSWK